MEARPNAPYIRVLTSKAPFPCPQREFCQGKLHRLEEGRVRFGCSLHPRGSKAFRALSSGLMRQQHHERLVLGEETAQRLGQVEGRGSQST